MKVTSVIGTVTLSAIITLGGVAACNNGNDTIDIAQYDDCSYPEDQNAKEDDCGYWQRGTEVRSGSRPDTTWLWVWFTWVSLGRTSYAPPGWIPPRGTTPSYTIKRVPRRKACALTVFAPPKPPAPVKPAGGSAPRVNNPAPAKPGIKQPVKPAIPIKPGMRPAGC